MGDDKTIDRSLAQLEEQHGPLPPHLQAFAEELRDVQHAQEVAEAADSTVIHDDQGNEVTSLKVRLSAAETVRVMSLPVEQRAAMAERILRERRQRADERKKVVAAEAKEKRAIKARRKRERSARKRGRR